MSILMLSSVSLLKIIYTYIFDDFFLKFVFLTVNEIENRLKNFYIYFEVDHRTHQPLLCCHRANLVSYLPLVFPGLPRRSIQSMT